MTNSVLITFGCSWTWGVGVGYKPDMSHADYMKICWDQNLADTLSFRGILSQRYGVTNINFSAPGSSNQRQFRKATIFFSSQQFKQLKEQGKRIKVLWGITSVARSEYYSVQEKRVIESHLNEDDLYSKFFVTHCYDPRHEIFDLGSQMIHWNDFFDELGVKNYWFDTFNHHDYDANDPSLEWYEKKYKDHANRDHIEAVDFSRSEYASYVRFRPVTNFAIDDMPNRDLASRLARNSGYTGSTDQYHFSNWQDDTDKIKFLTKAALLNPYTFHPTKKSHEIMADMLDHVFDGS